MQTSKLGIYVDLYHLLEEYYPAMEQMTKKDRLIMGDKILLGITECLAHVSLANICIDERIKHINELIARFEQVKVLLRFAIDTGRLQLRFRIPMFEYVSRIDEGIVKWRKFTLSRQPSRPSGSEESVE